MKNNKFDTTLLKRQIEQQRQNHVDKFILAAANQKKTNLKRMAECINK